MFCPSCGKEVSKDDRFCPNCGAKLDDISILEKDDEIQNNENIDTDNKELYASAFRRVGAYLIDIFIFYIVIFILSFILFSLGVFNENDLTSDTSHRMDLMGIVLGWLYFALQESSTRQATLGQRLLKLKVVDYNFQKISFLRATGRHFAMFLSILPLFLGLLTIFFTKRQQTLHDMIAGTLVIKEP